MYFKLEKSPMAKIWESNKPYTGLIPVPNIIDLLEDDSDKQNYIFNALNSLGVETQDITQSQALTLFNSVINHKNRVNNDGGKIGDYKRLVYALNFVRETGLSNVLAFSLAYGYKANAAGQPSKLYSFNGAAYDAVVDTPTRLKINGKNIDSNSSSPGSITIQTGFNGADPVFALSGEFGSSSTAGLLQIQSQNTNLTSTITNYEGLNLSSSGLSTAVFRGSDDTFVERPITSGRNYNKKGVALRLGSSIKAYSDAYLQTIEYQYSKNRKNMSSLTYYLNIKIGVLQDSTGMNSKLREAWFVPNGMNEAQAEKLAKILNYE